jgi:hypothetical protein
MLDVGLNEELPARLHQAVELGQEGLPDDPSLVMPLLPPGVGEVQRHPLNRSG